MFKLLKELNKEKKCSNAIYMVSNGFSIIITKDANIGVSITTTITLQ